MSENAIPQPNDAKEAFDDFRTAAKKAWEAGTSEAKKAAKDVVPRTRDAMREAAFEVIYDLAYGANFASELVKEFVPDAVTEATAKGGEAGRQAARDFMERRKNPEPEAEENAAGPVADGPAAAPDPNSPPAPEQPPGF